MKQTMGIGMRIYCVDHIRKSGRKQETINGKGIRVSVDHIRKSGRESEKNK